MAKKALARLWNFLQNLDEADEAIGLDTAAIIEDENVDSPSTRHHFRRVCTKNYPMCFFYLPPIQCRDCQQNRIVRVALLVVVNFNRDAGGESRRFQFLVFLHFHALQLIG